MCASHDERREIRRGAGEIRAQVAAQPGRIVAACRRTQRLQLRLDRTAQPRNGRLIAARRFLLDPRLHAVQYTAHGFLRRVPQIRLDGSVFAHYDDPPLSMRR
jgi:hypothetical protein